MIKAKAFLAVAMAATLLTSCDLLNCTPAEVKCLQIEFYDGEGNSAAMPDTLTVKVCGIDSILVNRSLNTKTLSLPLSYHAPVDTFILQNYGPDYSMEDTLFVDKTNNIYFESPDCPTVMMHDIRSALCTKTFLDSLHILNKKIDFTETTHIRLFIRLD